MCTLVGGGSSKAMSSPDKIALINEQFVCEMHVLRCAKNSVNVGNDQTMFYNLRFLKSLNAMYFIGFVFYGKYIDCIDFLA